MERSHSTTSDATSPLLIGDDDTSLSRPRRSLRRAATPPRTLRGAARFLRRASGRGMMLREPSMRVREAAAQQVEERQSDWAYSTPVVALDMLWNAAFVAISVAVVFLSADEDPSVPLRLWIAGYALQCALHMSCVASEFRRRRRTVAETVAAWDSSGDLNSASGSDAEDYSAAEESSDESGSGTRYPFISMVYFSPVVD